MEKINVDKLKELGIFELRNIAREVGVYLPTTLKKNELIKKITKILNGEEEPYVRTTKQGRPHKGINSIDSLVDVIVPSKIFEVKKDTTPKTCFCDYNESVNVNVVGSNETNFNAIIKVYENSDYALAFLNEIVEEKNKVVFIAKTQVDFYKLKSGDEISGKYVFVSNDKPLMLKEIYSINNINFSEKFVRAEDFVSLPALNPCDKLKMSIYKVNEQIFNNIDLLTPLAKGQRVLLQSQNINNLLNYQILNNLTTSVNSLQGLAILIDEMPENYYEIKGNNRITTISNNYNKSTFNFKLELEIKIERLKRLVENGEDVVLFINDLEKFINFIQNLYILENKNKENAKIYSEEYIKNIILLGKRTLNNGNLTVVCGTQNNENNLVNLFNNIINYKKQGFEYSLNLDKCNTYNIEKILTKQELNKLCELLKNK